LIEVTNFVPLLEVEQRIIQLQAQFRFDQPDWDFKAQMSQKSVGFDMHHIEQQIARRCLYLFT